MSDHRLTITHQRDEFVPEIVCDAAEDAFCRSTADCDCEVYPVIKHDEQGWYHLTCSSYFHLFASAVIDGVERCEVCKLTRVDCAAKPEEVKHRHHAYKGCSYMDWFQETDIIAEMGSNSQDVLIGQVPVTFAWGGEDYSWKVAK